MCQQGSCRQDSGHLQSVLCSASLHCSGLMRLRRAAYISASGRVPNSPASPLLHSLMPKAASTVAAVLTEQQQLATSGKLFYQWMGSVLEEQRRADLGEDLPYRPPPASSSLDAEVPFSHILFCLNVLTKHSYSPQNTNNQDTINMISFPCNVHATIFTSSISHHTLLLCCFCCVIPDLPNGIPDVSTAAPQLLCAGCAAAAG